MIYNMSLISHILLIVVAQQLRELMTSMQHPNTIVIVSGAMVGTAPVEGTCLVAIGNWVVLVVRWSIHNMSQSLR